MSQIEQPKLKLNYKNTFLMGLAFFVILMLWQLYNHYCPLFLSELLEKQTGKSNELLVGCIMAVDNLFAIFLLPIFGTLSDKTNTKWGKRMPYILLGMLCSAIVFPLIAVLYYIGSLVGVILVMLLILVIMNIYRNPAVALMPDLTPKPLRSKANGIINLVGYIGAVCGAVLTMFLKIENGKEKAIIAFVIASVLMIVAMITLYFTIKERKIAESVKEDLELGEKLSSSMEKIEDDKPLSKADKKNAIILLLSVLFWFISFNAVETFNSLFFYNQFGNSGIASTITIVLTFSSIFTFLLSLNLPSKIGRKNTVVIGLGCIILGFILILTFLAANNIFTKEVHELYGITNKEIYKDFGFENIQEYISENKLSLPFNLIPLYLCYVLCGIGWALINANSYPMMVEISSSKNIGKFTGYYYTFSMLAQTITPMAVGAWMYSSPSSTKVLYIYSAITMVIAAIIFVFFKENRKNVKQNLSGIEALGQE